MAREALNVRRWRDWLLAVFSTAGFALFLWSINVLLAGTGWRLDLTPDRQHTLSPHGRRVLSGLHADVQVTAFLRSGDLRNAEIEDLLDQIQRASPRIHVRLLDLNRAPAIAHEYGVSSYASIAVDSGGRRRVFANPTESLFVAALLQVTRPRRLVVYTLEGHGEADLQAPGRDGFSGARHALEEELFEVRFLPLAQAGRVPADADVVLLAGPSHDLLPVELAALSDYLRAGGRLLVLAEPPVPDALRVWLAQFGIEVGRGIVVDPDNCLVAGDPLTFSVKQRALDHPLTAGLDAWPVVSGAAVVRLNLPEDGPWRGIELLHSGAGSWETRNADEARVGGARPPDAGERRGALPLAVSVVRRTGENPAQTPGRLVVIGDRDFARNFFLDTLGCKDLLVNAVNWLAGEEALLLSRPATRTRGVNQVFLSAEEARRIFYYGTLLPPVVLLLLGSAVRAWRRWKDQESR